MTLAMKDITRYIKQQIKPARRRKRKVTVQSIARYFRVSRRWIYELIKKETNMTANQYINEIQFHHVQKLCKQRKRPTFGEVARKAGMSRSTLYRLFQNRIRKTPKQYSKENIEESVLSPSNE